MNNFKISRNKNVIKLFISLISVASIVFYIIFHVGQQYYKDVIFDNLQSKASTLFTLIDVDSYDFLLNSNNQDGSPLYEGVLGPLKKAHKNIPNIRYVYTAYQKDNKIFFGIDTAERVDTDKDGVIDHSDFRSSYDEPSETLKNVFKTKKSAYTTEPYSDKWGSFIGAYIPILNNKNELISVFAVEILYTQYQESLSSFLNFVIASYLISLLFIGLLCYYIYRSNQHIMEQIELNQTIAFKDKLLNQESKMADIGKLLAGITHEINNPLAVIGGAATSIDYALDESDNPNKDATIKKNIDRIHTQNKKIVKIIKSMKSLVRDGSQDPVKKENVKDMVDEFMILLNHKLRDHSIQVSMENISDETTLDCRQTQMQQVLVNLVTNSIDAIKGSENPWIKIIYKDDQQYSYLQVTDSGIGIPSDTLDKIFQGYFTTKEHGEGSGMGLLICKKIIESHNGTFEYIPGPNTTFQIKIPKFN